MLARDGIDTASKGTSAPVIVKGDSQGEDKPESQTKPFLSPCPLPLMCLVMSI